MKYVIFRVFKNNCVDEEVHSLNSKEVGLSGLRHENGWTLHCIQMNTTHPTIITG